MRTTSDRPDGTPDSPRTIAKQAAVQAQILHQQVGILGNQASHLQSGSAGDIGNAGRAEAAARQERDRERAAAKAAEESESKARDLRMQAATKAEQAQATLQAQEQARLNAIASAQAAQAAAHQAHEAATAAYQASSHAQEQARAAQEAARQAATNFQAAQALFHRQEAHLQQTAMVAHANAQAEVTAAEQALPQAEATAQLTTQAEDAAMHYLRTQDAVPRSTKAKQLTQASQQNEEAQHTLQQAQTRIIDGKAALQHALETYQAEAARLEELKSTALAAQQQAQETPQEAARQAKEAERLLHVAKELAEKASEASSAAHSVHSLLQDLQPQAQTNPAAPAATAPPMMAASPTRTQGRAMATPPSSPPLQQTFPYVSAEPHSPQRDTVLRPPVVGWVTAPATPPPPQGQWAQAGNPRSAAGLQQGQPVQATRPWLSPWGDSLNGGAGGTPGNGRVLVPGLAFTPNELTATVLPWIAKHTGVFITAANSDPLNHEQFLAHIAFLMASQPNRGVQRSDRSSQVAGHTFLLAGPSKEANHLVTVGRDEKGAWHSTDPENPELANALIDHGIKISAEPSPVESACGVTGPVLMALQLRAAPKTPFSWSEYDQVVRGLLSFRLMPALISPALPWLSSYSATTLPEKSVLRLEYSESGSQNWNNHFDLATSSSLPDVSTMRHYLYVVRSIRTAWITPTQKNIIRAAVAPISMPFVMAAEVCEEAHNRYEAFGLVSAASHLAFRLSAQLVLASFKPYVVYRFISEASSFYDEVTTPLTPFEVLASHKAWQQHYDDLYARTDDLTFWDQATEHFKAAKDIECNLLTAVIKAQLQVKYGSQLSDKAYQYIYEPSVQISCLSSEASTDRPASIETWTVEKYGPCRLLDTEEAMSEDANVANSNQHKGGYTNSDSDSTQYFYCARTDEIQADHSSAANHESTDPEVYFVVFQDNTIKSAHVVGDLSAAEGI